MTDPGTSSNALDPELLLAHRAWLARLAKGEHVVVVSAEPKDAPKK